MGDVVQIAFGGLLGALLAGAAAYLSFGRSMMSRNDHDKECKLRTAPIMVEIGYLKDEVGRLKEDVEGVQMSTDDSSQKLDEVLKLLRKT